MNLGYSRPNESDQGAHRAKLVNDLANFMSARGYDGIDIDWEPLEPSDAAPFSQFVGELRTALDAIAPRPQLTAAVASQPSLIAFYGIIWRGGAGTSTGGSTEPRQSWTTPPTISAVPYSTIMSDHYQPELYHWDTNAQAAFLSLDRPGSAEDRFISYDDEHACQAKISQARNRGLGGVMIWELGGGYRAGQSGGQRFLNLVLRFAQGALQDHSHAAQH